MLELIWKLLSTPPPKPEFAISGQLLELLETSSAKWLTNQIVNLANWVSTLLLSTPVMILESPKFVDLCQIIANISLAGVLPILAWIGVKTLLGQQDTELLVHVAGKLVIYSVAVYGIRPVIVVFVTFFNNLAHGLMGSGNGALGMGAFVPPGFILGLLIFLGVYLYLITRLIIYFAYRNFAVIALTVLAPLVFLLWVIDDTDQTLHRWLREFTGLLATQAVHAVLLLVLTVITVSVESMEYGLLMQIGALLYMNRLPEILMDYVQPGSIHNRIPVSIVNKLKGMVKAKL